MDRRYELAIDEKFERMVRESPCPRIINGDLPEECDTYEDQSRPQIVRPVPVGIVRNRENTSMSPHPRHLVSPYPQYTNTGNITRGANVYHPQYVDTGNSAYGANIIRPQYVNTGNSTHIANANESIEEIFDSIKQKSFDSSREDSHINVSNVCENDQSDGYGVSKDASVGTGDDSDGNSEDVETIECSFNAEAEPNHDTNIDNRHDKIVSSTVYSDYDEVDACDTGYGASNIKDTDLSALTDAEEQIRNVGSDSIRKECRNHVEKRKNRAHMNAVDDQIECQEIEEGENMSIYEDSALEKTTEKEPCVLYMWIIKPIPGSHCICVEGKKHPDEDEFWKSGMVTQRLDATTVLTHSGSIYKLIGDIEVADTVYAGFSQETVTAFKHGFPENWMDIIDDHFNNSLLDRPEVEETNLISSSVSEPPAFTEKQTSVTSKGKNQNYSLSNWVPKPLGQGVCVVGVNQDGMLWHSSAIEKRLKNSRLVTSSGSICTLKGPIDKLQAREENIPNEIITKFHAGFPKEWQELVQEYFTPEWFRVNEKAKNKKPSAEKGKDRSRNKTTPKHTVKQKLSKTDQKGKKVSETDKKIQQKSKDSVNTTAPARMNTSADSMLADTSVASESVLDQTVITPVGSFVNLCNLKRSRSGRLLRPPLHSWMGIHYEETENGLTLTGTEYAKTVLKEMEDQRKNASRVFARYNYTNKLDTTVSSVSSLSSTLSKSSQVSHPAGSSRKKTPANQLKKIDSTAVAKNGKKDIKTSTASASSSTSKNKLTLDTSSSKSKTASSSSTSKNKLTLDTCSSKSKISGTIKQSKAASSSKNNNSQKKKQEDSNKNVVKKIIVTKTSSTENGTESDLQGAKNLKIQQAPVKDSDPKLDEEVFVMLKEMKENFQRNKSPGRTTCYDSVEKVSRTRGKRLDASEDSYTLDESGESTNATKHRNESTDTVKEVNAPSCTKADTDKSSVASHVSVHLKDKSAKGDKRNSKKIKKNTNEKTSDSSSEKSNVNKTEGKTPLDKDISKGRKTGILRELHSLIMPDSGNKNSQIESRCYNTSNRVLRSKLRRGIKTVDYCESSEEDKKTKTKVGVTSEGSKDNPKIKTDKTKDANNKKESKNKNTNVNRRTKGKASSMGNERITDLSKEAGEEKVEKREEKSVKNNKQKDSIQNRSIEQNASDKKNKNQQNKKEMPKEVAITANVGTLKRRLQTKAFLEKQNENYEDDIFDSTPFRKSKKRKRPLIDDIDDDELFEELARKQGKSRFETPAGLDLRHRSGRILKLASARKTPACYSIKEDLIGSTMKNLDGYVHNLKKRQMLRAHRKLSRNQTPRLVKKTAKDDSPNKKLFQEFLNANKDETENEKDSDNEDDYYWDEETS